MHFILPTVKTGRSALHFVLVNGSDSAICAAAGGQDKAGIDREDCEALEKAVRGLLLEQSMRRQRQQASAAEALFTGRREAGITFSRRKVCAVAGWDPTSCGLLQKPGPPAVMRLGPPSAL